MYDRRDYDLVYTYGGRVSHVLPHGLPIPLCGTRTSVHSNAFFGTNSAVERQKANNLNKCPACVDANNQLGEMSYNLNRG